MPIKGKKQNWRHGKQGRGKGIQWIREHLSFDGDECLPWPFSKDQHYGRGRVGYEGKIYWAHHLMCILAKGPAPSPKHQTAHSCGNGHNGCVNPRHLSWKTNSENQQDRRRHGTQLGAKGSRATLSYSEIAEIRRLKGLETQVSLAQRFGVARGCIEYWQRSTHDPAPPGESASAIRRRNRRAA